VLLMAACGALLLAGLALIAAWGGRTFVPPPPPDALRPADVARRALWYVAVVVAAGSGGGLLVAGAGGRLAMRALAVTGGDGAQGRVTEAEEIVGRISTEGTVGLVVFVGLAFGFVTGVAYLLVRRWLPAGRLGGLSYGVLLLVLVGTTLDPLRPENPDFDIVGPDWLSVLLFGPLVIAQGMVVAAVAGRYSAALPFRIRRIRDALRYAPLVLVVPFAPGLVVVLVVAGAVIALSQVPPLRRLAAAPAVDGLGRVAVPLAALVAAPWFLRDLLDILGG
jgi:hypothetical protein